MPSGLANGSETFWAPVASLGIRGGDSVGDIDVRLGQKQVRVFLDKDQIP